MLEVLVEAESGLVPFRCGFRCVLARRSLAVLASVHDDDEAGRGGRLVLEWLRKARRRGYAAPSRCTARVSLTLSKWYWGLSVVGLCSRGGGGGEPREEGYRRSV